MKCQCRTHDGEHGSLPNHREDHEKMYGIPGGSGFCACTNEANSTVTISSVIGGTSRPEWQALGYGTKTRRALCAVCAEYYETKVGAR